MTIAEERALEVLKEGLTYVTEDSHSRGPQWHTSYGHQATFLTTEKQLSKEPQVQDMVN